MTRLLRSALVTRGGGLSVTRSMAIAGAAVAALVLAAVVLMMLATARFDAASSHARQALASEAPAERIARPLTEAKLALHRWLVSGSAADRQAWRSADGRLRRAVDRLVAAQPEPLPAAWRALVRARDAYLDGFAEPLRRHAATAPLTGPATDRAMQTATMRLNALERSLRPIVRGGQADAEATVAAAARSADRYRTAAIAVFVAVVGLLVLIGMLLTRGLLRPLGQLRQTIEGIGRGGGGAVLGEPVSAELREVSAAIAAASDRDRRLTGELEAARLEVLERLARATEHRDDQTHEHTERVGALAARLGAALGLSGEDAALLRLAAPLHDIGKIGVPDAILLKPGRLTSAEREQMQRHTTIGAQMLAGSTAPVLQTAERIALAHHERWDGTGYPQGLAGDEIPLAGRIVAVADVFDALTHDRPYKAAWPVERAVAEISQEAGTQFDPRVVAALLSLGDAVLHAAAHSPLPLAAHEVALSTT